VTSLGSLSTFAAAFRERLAAPDAVVGAWPFAELALELFRLQFRHNSAYRRLCEARGSDPGDVSDWMTIPAAPAGAFKQLELTSLPAAQRSIVFHSSGTTGQSPSRHFHSVESVALYEASLLPWFQRHLMADAECAARMSFIALAPAPMDAPHSSLAHMFATVQRTLGVHPSRFFCEAQSDGGWTLHRGLTMKALAQAVEAGTPLLLLGTAFSFVHLLDLLASERLRLELPPGSRVMETGGYKGRTRELPKPELHRRITRSLGVPASHIVSEYGMSELSSQAYDRATNALPDEPRVFRFPPWCRAVVVSPETGGEVGEGETGLLRVFDLANVWSVMALQTEDLAVRRGDGFELLGRAARAEPRGCSLLAGEPVGLR
jgi:hypothetical protein